jgi:hypothetical protein
MGAKSHNSWPEFGGGAFVDPDEVPPIARYSALLDRWQPVTAEPDDAMLSYLGLDRAAFRAIRAIFDAMFGLLDWPRWKAFPEDLGDMVRIPSDSGWTRTEATGKASAARAHFELSPPYLSRVKLPIPLDDADAYAARHAEVAAWHQGPSKYEPEGPKNYRAEVAYRNSSCPGAEVCVTSAQLGYGLRLAEICLLLPASFLLVVHATLDVPVFFWRFPASYESHGSRLTDTRKVTARRYRKGRDGADAWLEALVSSPWHVARMKDWPKPLHPIYIGVGQVETMM